MLRLSIRTVTNNDNKISKWGTFTKNFEIFKIVPKILIVIDVFISSRIHSIYRLHTTTRDL